jgi:hypothetical protein
MNKIVIDLPRPIFASNDCLPHAAMNLGSARGVGKYVQPALVHRIVIEPRLENWVMYRMDDRGGFVGDTWHGSLDDARHQAKREFGIDIEAPSI